jgi:predicted AlkP superfamily phosphohydrolase/phosphomutase
MKEENRLPNLARLLDQGAFLRMDSVHPYVSCVAWSSVMTGKNPGKHGIFGFADCRPGTYDVFIPNSRNLKSKMLWETLSEHGRRVVSIGVPVTYPPREVNGCLVSGFLAPAIEKGTYPPELGRTLKERGYIIDIDAQKARTDLDGLFPDLIETLDRRVETAMYLYDRENWDFFLVHFMETDRLHHFAWEYMEQGHDVYAPLFYRFYERLDRHVGSFLEKIDDDVSVIILSDHGFCSIRKEIYVNYRLEEIGWLAYRPGEKKTMSNIDWARTRAFCMDPGRIYLNLEGRQPEGIVSRGTEYDRLQAKLADELSSLTEPDSGDAVVRNIFTGRELFSGPEADRGPDLVIDSHWGYDVKGFHGRDGLTGKGPINGMHTFEDAMLFIRGESVAAEQRSVVDVMPTMMDLMGLPRPADVDGRSLIAG